MTQTIGGIIKASITAGKSNEQILQDVYAVFPAANTKAASVNWYRSQMKKDGAPQAPKAPKATPAKKTVAERVAAVYEVRGVRNQRGSEGMGYSCNLYRDGKKVAEVVDWAMGSPVEFLWDNPQLLPTMVNTVNALGEPHSYLGCMEEHLFAKHCMSLPKWTMDEKDPKTYSMHVSMDMAVEELVNHTILAKMVRQLCKKISYVTADGKLYSVSNQVKVTPGTIALHVPKDAKCLNTMTEAEAIATVRTLQ